MTPIETIKNILVADSTVHGLVDTRVSPVVRAQDEVSPAVVLTLMSVNPFGSLNDPPEIASNIVQVNCWAATYDTAQTLASACRTALEAAGLLMQGLSVRYEPQTDEFLISSDFLIWT